MLDDKPARKAFRISAARINTLAFVLFNLLLLVLETAAIVADRAGSRAVRDTICFVAFYAATIVLATTVLFRSSRRR
jgi:hypothetical protein